MNDAFLVTLTAQDSISDNFFDILDAPLNKSVYKISSFHFLDH